MERRCWGGAGVLVTWGELAMVKATERRLTVWVVPVARERGKIRINATKLVERGGGRGENGSK